MMKIDILNMLNDWFYNNCDGDWEHEYGIKICTTDDPGWSISIDLMRTPLEGLSFQKKKSEIDEPWYEVEVKENVFYGYGYELSKIIDVFYIHFLKPNLLTTKFTYTIYAKIPLLSIPVWRPITAKMVDINQFEIIDIGNINWEQLKVKEIENFDNLIREEIPTNLLYKEGDIVKCELVKMFDYPSLIICD